jgi:hypothetical protein
MGATPYEGPNASRGRYGAQPGKLVLERVAVVTGDVPSGMTPPPPLASRPPRP